MVTRVPTLNRRQSAARFRQLQRAGCKPKRVRLPNGDMAVVKSKDCPLSDNPKQPPKRWWRGCVRGVRDSGSGADPQRVCGDLWYNRLSASKRREILRREGKMEENPMYCWLTLHRADGSVVMRIDDLDDGLSVQKVKSRAEDVHRKTGEELFVTEMCNTSGRVTDTMLLKGQYRLRGGKWRSERRGRKGAFFSGSVRMMANPCPDGTCPNAGAAYVPNQLGGGLTTALLIGGALLAGWLLLKPKTASASTPPGQQPGLPPGGPATCPLTEQLLDAWGAARGISVIYIPGGLAQAIIALVNSIPTLAEGMQLGNQYVVVLGDGSFWTPTGLPPNTVPAPAPAQKDDYCAWAAQQPQTAPPVQAPSQTENGAPQAPSQVTPPNPVLPSPGSPLWTAQV